MVIEAPTPTRGRGWAVICLHETTDPLPLKRLHTDFTKFYPRGRYFFPAIRHEYLDCASPLSSYVFAVRDSETGILRLRQSRFVAGFVLDGDQKLARVSDDEVRAMVASVVWPLIRPGQLVEVLTGDWAGLTAKVIASRDGVVVVRIALCSLVREVALDRAAVKVVAS